MYAITMKYHNTASLLSNRDPLTLWIMLFDLLVAGPFSIIGISSPRSMLCRGLQDLGS